MKNSADLGGCYPPRPSASVDNDLLDLQNSSYPTQPHSIIANLSTTIRVITVVKMLWTHEAQPSESATNFDHWWRVSLSIKLCILNHIFFTTISTAKKMFFSERDQDRDTKKEQSLSIIVVYNFLAIWLVYSPKWTFLIGYYYKPKLSQEFWIERHEWKLNVDSRKYNFNCSFTANIQAEF